MPVTLREVSSKKDLKLFVRFPHTIYKDNQYWVPVLDFDDEALFDPKKNPAFENCRAKLWLAYEGQAIVGRVAGIISDVANKKWNNRQARFGWLDFIDDESVAKALMHQVESWASENDMTAVQGPMGFTDFDPEGLLTEGFDQPGTLSTIYNYEYYPRYLEKLGYKKDVEWLEYEVTIPSTTPERVRQFADIAAARYGLKVLQPKNPSQLRPYAKNVFELINVSYSNLYGVVPLSEKQIELYTSQYFSFIKTDFVSIIMKDDKLVAFAIAMPSLSNALRKAKGRLFPFGLYYIYRALQKNDVADLFLIAVSPDFRNKAVTSMLMHDLCVKFNRNGIKRAITHPMLDDNDSVLNIWKNFDKEIVRKRRCYSKQIGNQQ
jgi:hypothetical protein